MFWNDEDEQEKSSPSDIVDLSFRLQGKTMPIDFADALHQALLQHRPQLPEEPVAVMLSQLMEEGNGWYQAEAEDGVTYLPKRSRLILRVPVVLLEQYRQLEDKVIDLQGHRLTLGQAKETPLSTMTTLYARFVVDDFSEELEFLNAMKKQLEALGVRSNKLLCGRSREINIHGQTRNTRSLMLADLHKEDAFIVLRNGLGEFQQHGCGVFVPHKTIGRS